MFLQRGDRLRGRRRGDREHARRDRHLVGDREHLAEDRADQRLDLESAGQVLGDGQRPLDAAAVIAGDPGDPVAAREVGRGVVVLDCQLHRVLKRHRQGVIGRADGDRRADQHDLVVRALARPHQLHAVLGQRADAAALDAEVAVAERSLAPGVQGADNRPCVGGVRVRVRARALAGAGAGVARANGDGGRAGAAAAAARDWSANRW